MILDTYWIICFFYRTFVFFLRTDAITWRLSSICLLRRLGLNWWMTMPVSDYCYGENTSGLEFFPLLGELIVGDL